MRRAGASTPNRDNTAKGATEHSVGGEGGTRAAGPQDRPTKTHEPNTPDGGISSCGLAKWGTGAVDKNRARRGRCLGGWLSVDMSQGPCPRLAVTVWTSMRWMSACQYRYTPRDPHPWTEQGGEGVGGGRGGPPSLIDSTVGTEAGGGGSRAVGVCVREPTP